MEFGHDKYRLMVTAGPSYDTRTHQMVHVNDNHTLRIENEHSIVSVCVRVQDYIGTYQSSPAKQKQTKAKGKTQTIPNRMIT